MTRHVSNISSLAGSFFAAVFCVGMLTGCDNPKNDIKDLKSKVQLEYGQKKFKDSSKHAAEGLKLALEHVGPKNPDTLYLPKRFPKAISNSATKRMRFPRWFTRSICALALAKPSKNSKHGAP